MNQNAKLRDATYVLNIIDLSIAILFFFLLLFPHVSFFSYSPKMSQLYNSNIRTLKLFITLSVFSWQLLWASSFFFLIFIFLFHFLFSFFVLSSFYLNLFYQITVHLKLLRWTSFFFFSNSLIIYYCSLFLSVAQINV